MRCLFPASCVLTGDLLAIDFKFYCIMIHQVISIFRNLLRCVLCPGMCSILEKLPYAAVNTLCVLWCLGGIFYRYLLNHWILVFLCLIFVQMTCQLEIVGCWNYLLLWNWDLQFGAPMFKIAMLSWIIVPLVRMHWCGILALSGGLAYRPLKWH